VPGTLRSKRAREAPGVIINMGSVQGVLSQKGVPAYAASKGAMLSLTRQMAMDYGTCVCVDGCGCGGGVLCAAGSLGSCGEWGCTAFHPPPLTPYPAPTPTASLTHPPPCRSIRDQGGGHQPWDGGDAAGECAA
jgi:hypothetical protein